MAGGREVRCFCAAPAALAQAAFRPFASALSAIGRHSSHLPAKTEVADWYPASILSSLWGLVPERFASQAFRDCFAAVSTGESLPAGLRDNWSLTA
jgi:hypothetical protein